MKKPLLLIILVFSIVSCSNSEMYDKISGEWECSSWINTSKNIDKCKGNVHFIFSADKSYSSILGSEKDSGSYRIVDNLLYVTPRGEMEFAVRIDELSTDTLVFLMNLAGEKEILTLTRIP